MRIVHTVFDRPWPPTRHVHSPPEWQGLVLVPGDKPIRVWRFIKERGSKHDRLRAKNLAGDAQQTLIFGQLAHWLMLKGVSRAGAAARANNRAEHLNGLQHLIAGKNTWNYGESRGFNLLRNLHFQHGAHSLNSSLNLLVWARLTGISLCFLSSILI